MPTNLHLTLRRQEALTTDHHDWRVIEAEEIWPAAETALIVVDMWDQHWSRGAAERVDELAPHLNAVLHAARGKGVQIIHAPSDVVDAYADHPARQRALAIPQITPPRLLDHPDPPLPIDDSDGGSDTGETTPHRAWTRQHPAVEIAEGDALSADGEEVYRFLMHHNRRNLLYAGVHTNMCVLNRSFAIKQMVRWGFKVALCRDLTDAMYNPLKPPYVSHQAGTDLVIAYIEKFWCPTIHSADFVT